MQAAELFEQKSKPSKVAQRLRVSLKPAYQWHQLWRVGGREALTSHGPSGSRCRLSPRCLEKLAGYLEQGPAEHGWVEDQVWTAARVATLIGRKFHVSYSVSGATRLMHRLGFSPQVPARRVAERDEQAVTAWKEATWDEVKGPGRPAGDFPGPAAGEFRVQHRVAAHFHQGRHPHLDECTPPRSAAVAGTAEGGLVGFGIGDVPAGPVDGQQPQAPPERTGRRLGGHRLRGRREQNLQWLGTQPLPGPEQRGLGWNVPVAQQPQTAQSRDQVSHDLEIRSRREQRKPQHEVHDQPRRKQSSTLL